VSARWNVSKWVEEERPRIAALCGEPIRAFLPSLSPSGTAGAMMTMQLVSGLGGQLLQRKANRSAGDAASIKVWQSRYGLLVLTEDDRIKLYRTKMAGKRTKIEAVVGDWSRGDVQIELTPGRGTTKITISPDGEPTMFFEYISAFGGANQLVAMFAQAAGVPLAA
jgi:hypothetical protein